LFKIWTIQIESACLGNVIQPTQIGVCRKVIPE